MSQTVLELSLTCDNPTDAQWIMKLLRSSVAEHNGIKVGAFRVLPVGGRSHAGQSSTPNGEPQMQPSNVVGLGRGMDAPS